MHTAIIVKRRLQSLTNPDQAAILQRFFKTGIGGYGEGDRFLGIKVPLQRKVARQFVDLSLSETVKLLQSPWHECRLTALIILVLQSRRADDQRRRQICRAYLKHRRYINNWDLVDVSAEHIVGPVMFGTDCATLFKLAKSRLWNDRRIAVLTTFHFIRRHEFIRTLQLAEMLLCDTHDLLHKAVGWMLREIGKRDEETLRRFLDKHAPQMPRTMLRYSIELLKPSERMKYLSLPRVQASR